MSVCGGTVVPLTVGYVTPLLRKDSVEPPEIVRFPVVFSVPMLPKAKVEELTIETAAA